MKWLYQNHKTLPLQLVLVNISTNLPRRSSQERHSTALMQTCSGSAMLKRLGSLAMSRMQDSQPPNQSFPQLAIVLLPVQRVPLSLPQLFMEEFTTLQMVSLMEPNVGLVPMLLVNGYNTPSTKLCPQLRFRPRVASNVMREPLHTLSSAHRTVSIGVMSREARFTTQTLIETLS